MLCRPGIPSSDSAVNAICSTILHSYRKALHEILQRLCLLAAGYSESLLETRLRLVCIRASLPPPQLAFESMLLTS